MDNSPLSTNPPASSATKKDDLTSTSAVTHLGVFLSYGHDDHATLAKQIKADLEQRGHEVWFDADQLEVGKVWE
jgi:hypothetical protein